MLATPIVASAQPVTGLYVGLGAGVNITQKTDINSISVSGFIPGTGFVSTGVGGGSYNGSVGFAGVLSLGWGFGNGLRAEIEANYRGNNNDGISGNTLFSSFGGATGGGTKEQKYGGMVNVLYDFVGLTPYFHAVCDSCVEGVEKPDPRFFRIVLDRAGGRPETAMHVGDLYYVDVVGARNAGIRPLLLDPHGLYRGFDVPRIVSLSELVSLVLKETTTGTA
jgi:hypothetical protein